MNFAHLMMKVNVELRRKTVLDAQNLAVIDVLYTTKVKVLSIARHATIKPI